MTTFCHGYIENQPECEGLLLNYIEMLANLRQFKYETLPKALRTQALTALTIYFGLVGLVQYAS